MDRIKGKGDEEELEVLEKTGEGKGKGGKEEEETCEEFIEIIMIESLCLFPSLSLTPHLPLFLSLPLSPSLSLSLSLFFSFLPLCLLPCRDLTAAELEKGRLIS